MTELLDLSLDDCTRFLILSSWLMGCLGWQGDNPFFLCAKPACGCITRCIAFDTYNAVTS